MTLGHDIRWKQRIANFDRGMVLLREALEDGPDALSPLEKEGLVQRFEYTLEMALTSQELTLLHRVFRRHPEVAAVKLFGSRAKGTHTPRSDIDLALFGDVDALRAEAIASELDELPLPDRHDVKPFQAIKLPALREHIERVGILIYP